MNRLVSTRAILVMLLVPVVRWALHRSVSVKQISESLKEAAIKVAAADLESLGVMVTVSKLSLATGITRREVSRLFRDNKPNVDVPGVIGRVIVQWEQDKRLTGPDGKPKLLSYKGKNSQFHILVNGVSKDVNPSAVLFELVRVGIVAKEGDFVRLLKTVQFHTHAEERAYEILTKDIDTHISAVQENLEGDPSRRNLHLRTEFDNIFEEDLPRIREWLLDEGAQFHKRARDFLSQYDRDLNPGRKKAGGARVIVGAFSWAHGGKENPK